jgi:DNA-binding transcriptional ArsR family regulator
VNDQLGLVFAALADPTRRRMVQALLQDGSTSVPALTETLPITRQAIAKHIATLDHAGLIERSAERGREVRYRLRPEALGPASAWLAEADAAWAKRLDRLKEAVEARTTDS